MTTDDNRPEDLGSDAAGRSDSHSGLDDKESDMTNDQPISNLDERLDDLVRALAQMPNLEEMLEGMRAHEEIAAEIGPDFPGVVDVLAGVEFRKAVAGVMEEVLFLKKQKGSSDGSP